MPTRSKRFVAGIIALLGMIVFSATLVHALWYAPETEIVVTNPTPTTTPKRPIMQGEDAERLTIPSLNVDAAVQQVGINTKGNMGIPSNFTDVGWYKYGPIPGQVGSAVMDGHVDNGLGLAGVFKHLGDIQIGDDVYVQTKGGNKLHFVVTDIQSYPYLDAPNDQIFNQSDVPRLNLITCEGNWVKADMTYDQRLVVYTVLAPG